MQQKHLVTALLRALDRYGTPRARTDATPPTDADPLAPATSVPLKHLVTRPSFPHRSRRPGWVSVGEIEAAQSPNTYPRLTRKAIRDGCRALAQQEGSPVGEVAVSGLRTWVRVVPPATVAPVPNESARSESATSVTSVTGEAESAPHEGAAPEGTPPELAPLETLEIVPPDSGPHGASGAGPTG